MEPSNAIEDNWALMSDWRNEDWGDQNSYGIDLAQLRYNLALSDSEKIDQHDRALRFAILCRKAALESGKPVIPNPNLDLLVEIYNRNLAASTNPRSEE